MPFDHLQIAQLEERIIDQGLNQALDIFLDTGPGSRFRTGCAVGRRVAGISRGHSCCTLLLYNRPRLFELCL